MQFTTIKELSGNEPTLAFYVPSGLLFPGYSFTELYCSLHAERCRVDHCSTALVLQATPAL